MKKINKKDGLDKPFSKGFKAKDFLNKDVSLKQKTEKKNPLETKKIEDITIDDIKLNPEKFIEINIITKNRILERHYVFTDNEKFKINTKEYKIDPELFAYDPKGNYIIPCLYYLYGEEKPIDLRNHNMGIPSKVLTLLYDSRLYRMLIHPDDTNLNWIVIIVNIAQVVVMCVALYLLHANGYLNF